MNCGYDKVKIPSGSPSILAATVMICSGDFTGNGRSTSPFTIPKIAVFAPIPSAKVSTTIVVNIGDFASIRNAYRTSCPSVPMNPPLRMNVHAAAPHRSVLIYVSPLHLNHLLRSSPRSFRAISQPTVRNRTPPAEGRDSSPCYLLCPAQCITPKYSRQGPTVSRYWCAITRVT